MFKGLDQQYQLDILVTGRSTTLAPGAKSNYVYGNTRPAAAQLIIGVYSPNLYVNATAYRLAGGNPNNYTTFTANIVNGYLASNLANTSGGYAWFAPRVRNGLGNTAWSNAYPRPVTNGYTFNIITGQNSDLPPLTYVSNTVLRSLVAIYNFTLNNNTLIYDVRTLNSLHGSSVNYYSVNPTVEPEAASEEILIKVINGTNSPVVRGLPKTFNLSVSNLNITGSYTFNIQPAPVLIFAGYNHTATINNNSYFFTSNSTSNSATILTRSPQVWTG